MIGVDTNVLLRLMILDDPIQNEIAGRFFRQRSREDPAFVSLVVFAECCWVMRKAYGYTNSDIMNAMDQLLLSEHLVFEGEDLLETLIFKDDVLRGDISDHLISALAANSGCIKTMTFDVDAARRVPGMELLA